MFLLSSPSVALSANKCSLKFTAPIQPSYSNSAFNRRPKFISLRNYRKPSHLTLSKAEGGLDSASLSAPKQSHPRRLLERRRFGCQEDTLLEGVIHRVALLAGGDVLALLLFSAIGIYNHGLPNFSMDRLRKADSFMAGWFLSACFLGGYGKVGQGANGLSKAVIAAAKSWVGIDYMGCNIRPYSSIYLCLSNNGKHFRFAYRVENIIDNIFAMKQRRRMMYINMAARLNSFELLTSLVWRW